MTLATVFTRANVGVDAPLVTVETHLSNGLPSLTIVGLPETAVRESRERVRCAILNANLEFPARRITINLAPADLPKSGGRFDLAIAVSILAASGQLPAESLERVEFLGELALEGSLRPVDGVLPALLAARSAGRALILPSANRNEAGVVSDAKAFAGQHLLQVCLHLKTGEGLEPCPFLVPARLPEEHNSRFSQIRGQAVAKRALVVAAAGAHHLLLVGPPGTGKTLLANSLRDLLPPLEESAALEAAAIRSISRQAIDPPRWRQPVFRTPHHSATSVAIVGGGSHAHPGEVTLAHRGVLFLDELTEFKRSALEALREPLEAGIITLSRANYRLELPANFQLVAAMNPCPCGYFGDPQGRCICTPERVQRYLEKISGPLLDRLDLIIEMPRLLTEELRASSAPQGPLARETETLKAQIAHCRQRQLERNGHLNRDLSPADLDRFCPLDDGGAALLARAIDTLALSARACHRILKIARTLADLDDTDIISRVHVAEAISYRRGLKPPGARAHSG